MAGAFSIKRVALLKGHTDSVTCLDSTSDGSYVASGSEDGWLCVHSLKSCQLLAHVQLSEHDAVAAVVFQPTATAGDSSRTMLYAATGRELQQIAVVAAQPEVHIQQHPNGIQHRRTNAAAAEHAPMELHVMASELVTVDDISALAVNQQGTYLAAADDSGDITLFDLAKLQQLQHLPQKQSLLQPFRTIKSAHDPLASAVSFRKYKPWQLLSAGLDSKVACWDYSRPRRCCASWNMTEMAENTTPTSEGSDQKQGGGQIWNPPMVHALAVPLDGTSSSSSSADGNGCTAAAVAAAPALLRRVVAVARGDGIVAVFDADGDAKPSKGSNISSSSSSSSKAKCAVAPPSSKHGGNVGKESSKQRAKAAAAAAAVIEQQSSSQQQEQLHQQDQAQAIHQPLFHLQPGFNICLGPSLGGHRVPASAVTFLPWAGGCRYLISGAEDGRLLLWDWQAAAAAGGLPAPAIAAGDAADSVTAEATPAAGKHDGLPASAMAQEVSTTRALLVDRQHKRKVNALCCVQQQHRCLVLVADTSDTVSVMLVVQPSSTI